jgi:hypothetical protein
MTNPLRSKGLQQTLKIRIPPEILSCRSEVEW